MDIYNQILDENELKYHKINDEIFKEVLTEFFEKVDASYELRSDMAYTDKFLVLLNEYIYHSNYIVPFYEILKKYHYNMKQEIKDAIFELGNLRKTSRNSKLIKKLLNSPVIQDISLKERKKYEIYSEKYGTFSFELASKYFRKNSELKDYISSTVLAQECHSHAYYMSKIFKDYYAITSLCRYYFKGNYYHSYTYDKDSNLIFDLCSNAVFIKDEFDDLFETNEILVVKNKDLEEQLSIADFNSIQPESRRKLLRLALFKQSLNLEPDKNLDKKVYTKTIHK